MSLNISLYTISAVLILDNEGNRVFSKYYHSSLEETSDSQFETSSQQIKFEKSLFGKINKINQDILLYDNHLIVYKQTNDVIVVLVAKINENESLIYSTLANLFEAISILLDNTIDKQTILDKFDMVSLAIDETIDDGIIIEYDPATIVSRVTNPPSSHYDVNLKNIDISEKGIFNALSFASKKIGERLQQGL
ncbi:golgi-to-ER vesicle coat component [Spathaspora passalidarum NRRL Y-27907]|uniref:Coatomer subunit zeta n=1 Tax=Spathaspora passalidarum (strain NRRL Y-27907 / 11-Y1) TaxID=619300 RepID=G3AHZ4_SPAPN|nr:golgi-to-ER vesicle coat component [Spathaspora passalidarum NRRL Y-27907]EGW34308.1 golgi-to-ER vesicle coat component [Spathaspora passalidarum NRRL Y-27907]